MLEQNEGFNIEAFAEEKRKKYEELIKKFSNSEHKEESIKVEGFGEGQYKKVDDYYISVVNDGRSFFIAKAHQIKNNKLLAYVDIYTGSKSQENVKYITYCILSETQKDMPECRNLNGVISKLMFSDDGKLKYVYTHASNEDSFITPEEAIKKIEKEILDKESQIKRLEDEKERINTEIQSLKTSKIPYEKLVAEPKKDKIVLGKTLKICNACNEHVVQLYGAREFMTKGK